MGAGVFGRIAVHPAVERVLCSAPVLERMKCKKQQSCHGKPNKKNHRNGIKKAPKKKKMSMKGMDPKSSCEYTF